MHIMIAMLFIVGTLISGILFIAHYQDHDSDKKWEMLLGVLLLLFSVLMIGWVFLSMNQDSRVSQQYKIPVTKVFMPDGTYKQVFAYPGTESGLADAQKQFGTILPDQAQILVTEYDQSSYYGITYGGLLHKTYQPFIPR